MIGAIDFQDVEPLQSQLVDRFDHIKGFQRIGDASPHYGDVPDLVCCSVLRQESPVEWPILIRDDVAARSNGICQRERMKADASVRFEDCRASSYQRHQRVENGLKAFTLPSQRIADQILLRPVLKQSKSR